MNLSFAALRVLRIVLIGMSMSMYLILLVIANSPGSGLSGLVPYLAIAAMVFLLASAAISYYLSKFRKRIPVVMSDQGIKLLGKFGISARNSRSGCYVLPPRGFMLVKINHDDWLKSIVRNSSGGIIAVLFNVRGQYEVVDATHYEVRLNQGNEFITGDVYDHSNYTSGPRVCVLQPSKIADFGSLEDAMRPMIEEADSAIIQDCVQALLGQSDT